MAQTILSVVLEVQPQSAGLLRDIVSRLKDTEERASPKYPREYQRMHDAVPLLHFMSLSVCADADYDPVFVLEANFDGPPGPFWAELEAVIGDDLRDMLRCMKPPGGKTEVLFRAVTEANSRRPIAPLLEASTVTPAVFHQGNRGLDRARIEREAALLFAARTLADDSPGLRSQTPVQIHAALRKHLLSQYPWMGAAVAPRIGMIENLMDWVRLLGFAAAALIVLALPAVVGGFVFTTALLPLLVLLLAIYYCLRIANLEAVDGHRTFVAWLCGLAVMLAFAANVYEFHEPGTMGLPVLPGWLFWTLCGVLGMAASAAGLILWLRHIEEAEPSLDAPVLDETVQARIARSEDQTVQNHMISLVHVKPGILRAVLIRAGLWGLGYLLRVSARDGYLSSMRTIHFAHWALVDGQGRLMFHSNFDGSWESYLDDFIEKAHVGLTLAWTNGVGFPATKFLINGGATQGRKFKAWARHSMTESLFWFSAYKDFTVNQIERQARLAEGLRKTALAPQEAETWILDL